MKRFIFLKGRNKEEKVKKKKETLYEIIDPPKDEELDSVLIPRIFLIRTYTTVYTLAG